MITLEIRLLRNRFATYLSSWEIAVKAFKISLSCAGVVCYDDACHLKKYAQNPICNELTEVAKRLNNITMVCDRFHFRNHVDSWCKKKLQPSHMQWARGKSHLRVSATLQFHQFWVLTATYIYCKWWKGFKNYWRKISLLRLSFLERDLKDLGQFIFRYKKK